MGACYTPFNVNDKKAGAVYTVPCGKCPNCASRRISGWSFRLLQEYKKCTSAHFLTLTYADDKLKGSPSGLPTLDKTDVQKFMKKLRKTHATQIKYYTVGEYGGQTQRPHYHIIIFNARIDLIQPAWQHGQIHYGTVTPASIGYSLKYMAKPKTVPAFDLDDRTPEFSLFSKGLGASYLSDAIKTYHKADLENRAFIPIEDGKKIAMPRYFKNKLYDEEERARIAAATILRLSEQLGKPLSESDERSRQAGILAAFQKQKKKDNTKNKI